MHRDIVLRLTPTSVGDLECAKKFHTLRVLKQWPERANGTSVPSAVTPAGSPGDGDASGAVARPALVTFSTEFGIAFHEVTRSVYDPRQSLRPYLTHVEAWARAALYARRYTDEGIPLAGGRVNNGLNNLAAQCNIVDDTEQVFHFGCHAFRHTKGVELINSGVPLVYVQKWFAHSSPEMTLRYARILANTMRDEWEKAFRSVVVRVDSSGSALAVPPDSIEADDRIDWEHIRLQLDAIRLADGYCFKPKKQPCPTQKIPCHTCVSFCTTPAFLPQFQRTRAETQELIQIDLNSGRTHSADCNRPNLEAITPIIDLLE